MKKIITVALASFLLLSGCQEIQNQTENLQKESEKTINNLSQQAENAKNEALKVKAQIDEKSQQIVDAAEALNKLTK